MNGEGEGTLSVFTLSAVNGGEHGGAASVLGTEFESFHIQTSKLETLTDAATNGHHFITQGNFEQT